MHSAAKSLALLFVFAIGGYSLHAAADTPPRPADDALLEDVEHRTFQYFWETANPANGMVPDRYPTRSFASIAAIGFGLTAYVVGAERGYVTREQARERVLTTLRFFDTAKSGTQVSGITGYRGFFYHFLDMKTGTRDKNTELSTIDTSLLLAGMLLCESYFDRPDEVEIPALVERIYGRVDWQWAQVRKPLISMGWDPQIGFIPADWSGYNEAMIVYIFALGSPTHPVQPEAWTAWTASYSWGTSDGQEHVGFPPLFGHQYSQVWIDFRGIHDAFMREKKLDYFQNSRRATYAQQAYAKQNPRSWSGYDENVWGLTACDGPVNATFDGKRFLGYAARGASSPPDIDDGTIAPTAAAGSLPFAPEIVLPALQAMKVRYGTHIYGKYGFLDSFNPSFHYDTRLSFGHLEPGLGWVATDYLGIDQGPIVAMIENYRSEIIWKTMRKNPHIRTGLKRAGFTGGWLQQQ